MVTNPPTMVTSEYFMIICLVCIYVYQDKLTCKLLISKIYMLNVIFSVNCLLFLILFNEVLSFF